MVKLNIPRALSINSFKLEFGGGPGCAVGGRTEFGREAELVFSVLVQNAEVRKLS